MEEGSIKRTRSGTPQGGVISPLLANIYLHEVLDKWFEAMVKPRLMKEAFLIRYADDFVIVFASGEDARKVMKVLPDRFGKYGITGNLRTLYVLRGRVIQMWRKWLMRRSQRRRLRWDCFRDFLNQYPLPPARIVHSVYHGVAIPLF